jgi:replicative DNA helicase
MKVKLPPQNLEAEQSVLGGLMLEADAWDAVVDLVSEKDFYKDAHQKIFSAVGELHKRNQPIDILTVSNFLKDKNELDEIGGPAYLGEIINFTPSAANITTYAEIVAQKALLRRLITTTAGIAERAYESDFENVNSFLDQVESEVFAIADTKKTSGLVAASEIVRVSLEKIEEMYHRKATMTGVSSGFKELDKMTAGFQAGDLIVVAARPSMGKTALGLNMAQHAALKDKKNVAFFSVEMGKEAVMMRMLAAEARVSISDVRLGKIPDSGWPNLIHAASRLSEANLYIDDTSSISPFEIRAKARRLKAAKGLDIIFIDYLQIMDLKMKVENRERQVSEISRTLKAIAKELQIPVVALAQLNRSVEGRAERQPMLSDLRESGSIEQDADLIMMIYREDYYERENSEQKGIAEILIRKQRNGPVGGIKLKWTAELGRFENLEYSDAPPPSTSSPNPSGPSRLKNFANFNGGNA